jgi:uncharacterized protein
MNRKRSFHKIIFNTVKLLLALYALAGILLWTFQDRLIFQATQLPANYQFDFKEPHRELLIPVTEKEKLSIVQFYPTDTTHTKGVVLYFHGNRENITHYAKFAPLFTKHGYEIWMMDYPGYGKSTGTIKEKRLYADALLLYKMAIRQTTNDNIIIYGKSLGTGVAAELASHEPCKQLILETPYYSFPSLAAQRFPVYPAATMVRYHFPVYEYLQQVKVPVTIFHGTGDEVIPYTNSEKLKKFLKAGDIFVTINNGKHNNLSEFAEYQHKMDSLLMR